MKFLFCINDDRPDNLPATREVFKKFVKQRKLSNYKEYGYQPRLKELGSIRLMENEVLNIIKDYEPDLIHWNQLNIKYSLSNRFIEKLYAINHNLIITQETVDSFNSIPKAMLKVGRKINLTLMNCGDLVDEMNKKGCKTILFPEKSTETLFTNKNYEKNNRIVFIGNNNCSRNPFKYREKFGPRYRIKLVKAMKKEFGDTFQIYGRGWDGIVDNNGYLPYPDQEKIMKSAKFLFGCNIRNYYRYYFSNRLLNYMLSGTPVIYQYNPGYEVFFEEGKHLFLFKNIQSAINKIHKLLDKDYDYLSGIGYNAKNLVLKKHTAEKRYRYYLKLVEALKNNNLDNIEPDFFLKD